jgi:hypothetical protein
MLRNRVITYAKYHAHRWRSVSRFTDSNKNSPFLRFETTPDRLSVGGLRTLTARWVVIRLGNL